jgi:hypothetical protein
LTLVLVPPGRGRWSPISVQYDPKRRALPNRIEVRVNDRMPLDGVVYRVAKVMP